MDEALGLRLLQAAIADKVEATDLIHRNPEKGPVSLRVLINDDDRWWELIVAVESIEDVTEQRDEDVEDEDTA